MSDTTTVHDQYYEMANAPVNRIIPKLAVPTIISMLVTSIYNMADTFFVSQLGTSASGAIGIVFSAMAIIQALSFMVGMGSGNYIARVLHIKSRMQKLITCDRAVANAAPEVPSPRLKIKIGSRIIFRIPPVVIPTMANRAFP